MDIKISPKGLSGEINAVSSKSEAHRLLICAALSDKETEVKVLQRSKDIDTTAKALTALGAGISYEKGSFWVSPIRQRSKSALIDCFDSGSTLRFLLPVAALVSDETFFTGTARLPDRPIAELIKAMEKNGAVFSGDRLPFRLKGNLRSGDYILPGNVSSQYVSGLLMALPKLEGDSRIILTSELESSSYVDLSLSCLEKFGVRAEKREKGFFVTGFQKHQSPEKVFAGGDWSAAAFFLAAGVLGGPISLCGLDEKSPQADRAVIDILRRFGGEISVSVDKVTAAPGLLEGIDVDLSETPDLLPVLSVVAAFSQGETRFYKADRLRGKESDRLSACAAMLNKLGGLAHEQPEGLVVQGKPLKGGTVEGFGDHRMVMAAAIGAAFSQGDTIITGAQAAEKSYPDFFEDYRRLGGIAKAFLNG